MSFDPARFERHSEILKKETEVVELSSFFLPEELNANQMGAARMMIRHSFRSGYALGGQLDPNDVVDSVLGQLSINHELNDDERDVVQQFPDVFGILRQAYEQGAQARNG